MSVIRRREFIVVLGGMVALPPPLRAQQAAKVYRIGYLGVTSHAEYAREIEALLKGLAPTRVRGRKEYCHLLSVRRGTLRSSSGPRERTGHVEGRYHRDP